MVMPPCGTCDYRAIVPAGWPAQDNWQCEDQSGALELRTNESIRKNRLVGHHPLLKVEGNQVTLQAIPSDHAQAQAFSLSLDRRLIDVWLPGDVLQFVRTATANLGVSTVRNNGLVTAVGVITCLQLGQDIRASSVSAVSCPDCDAAVAAEARHCHQCGASLPSGLPSTAHPLDSFKGPEGLLDITVHGESRRLGRGGHTELGGYEITVLHGFRVGIPGTHECAAISTPSAFGHDAAISSAAKLAGILLDPPLGEEKEHAV